jgi:hypothetical protein
MRTSFGCGAKLAQQERHRMCREERLSEQQLVVLPSTSLGMTILDVCGFVA